MPPNGWFGAGRGTADKKTAYVRPEFPFGMEDPPSELRMVSEQLLRSEWLDEDARRRVVRILPKYVEPASRPFRLLHFVHVERLGGRVTGHPNHLATALPRRSGANFRVLSSSMWIGETASVLILENLWFSAWRGDVPMAFVPSHFSEWGGLTDSRFSSYAFSSAWALEVSASVWRAGMRRTPWRDIP